MGTWHAMEGCWSGGMMGVGMLLMWLIPIGLIGGLLWYLTRKNTPPPPERAIDILEKAYVRGEISREDFLSKRGDLSAPTS